MHSGQGYGQSSNNHENQDSEDPLTGILHKLPILPTHFLGAIPTAAKPRPTIWGCPHLGSRMVNCENPNLRRNPPRFQARRISQSEELVERLSVLDHAVNAEEFGCKVEVVAGPSHLISLQDSQSYEDSYSMRDNRTLTY